MIDMLMEDSNDRCKDKENTLPYGVGERYVKLTRKMKDVFLLIVMRISGRSERERNVIKNSGLDSAYNMLKMFNLIQWIRERPHISWRSMCRKLENHFFESFVKF